jgi:hypothetical protein
MVITIHKLPVDSFTFLQCLSGTELLNLKGTPSINESREDSHDILQFASMEIVQGNQDFHFSVLLGNPITDAQWAIKSV